MKGFAHALLGGPVWADALVQRVVNAGMHALMRRGMSKAAIRSVLGRAAVVALVATFAAYLLNDEAHGLWAYIIPAAIVASLAWIVRVDARDDLREDAASMPVRRRFDWTDRAWWWATLVEELIEGALGRPFKTSADTRMWVFGIIGYMLMLVLAYSGHTPPRPPARRVLVPAKAGA